MRSLVAGLLVIFFSSCTHTSYLTSGKIPVYVGARLEHKNKLSAEGKRSFFLWGMVPKEHKVYMDRELSKLGLVSAANLVLEEHQTWDDFAVSVLSMGLFIKKSYKITAYGKLVEKE